MTLLIVLLLNNIMQACFLVKIQTRLSLNEELKEESSNHHGYTILYLNLCYYKVEHQKLKAIMQLQLRREGK